MPASSAGLPLPQLLASVVPGGDMTLVQPSRPDAGLRYGVEDGALSSVLDEYLQEIDVASLRGYDASLGGQHNHRHGEDSDSPPDAAPSQQQGPSTRQRNRPAAQEDWSPSDGSEDSSPRPKRSATRKRAAHRGARFSSRRTQELQEKNRQAQQRFRQRQREKVTELEDLVVDLNKRVQQLTHDNAQLEHRVGELSEQHSQRGDSGQLGSDATASPKQETAILEDKALHDDLVLTVRPDRETVLSPCQLRELSVSDLINIWKEYRTVLTRYTNAGDAESDGTSADRVKQLVYELMVLLMRVAVHNPVVTKSFVAGNMERVGSLEAEDMHVWRDVMRLLELTPEQKQRMVELRHFFLAKLRSILDRRKAIHADITDSLPEAYNARHAARQYLKGHQSLEQLKGNMREEHVLKLDWISTIFNHIWSPMQSARCLVLSWPYTPDTFAMACWVGVEQGDPTALSVCTPTSPRARGERCAQCRVLPAERQRSDPGFSAPAAPSSQAACPAQARSNSSPISETAPVGHASTQLRTASPQPHAEHVTLHSKSISPDVKSSSRLASASLGEHPAGQAHRLQAHACSNAEEAFAMPVPNPDNFSFPPDVTLPTGIFPPLHVQSPLLMPLVQGTAQCAHASQQQASSYRA